MKNPLLPVIVCLSAAGFAATAQAQTGYAIELLAGEAKQTTRFSFLEESMDFTDKSRSYGIRASYQFNPGFGIELGHIDFGEIEDNYVDDWGDHINERAKSSATLLGARLAYPVSQQVWLVGRVGIARWDYAHQETDSAFPGEVFSSDDDGQDRYYGLALEYNLSRTLRIGIDYNHFKMKDVFKSSLQEMAEEDVDLVGASIRHKVRNVAITLGLKF